MHINCTFQNCKNMHWKSFLSITAFLLLLSQQGFSLKALPKGYSSYRTLPWCNPSDYFRYPKTAQDVVAIVQEAIQRGVKVKAFGARHSQTDIICTEGIPIDNHGLKAFRLNDDLTATFGAGVTLHEATEFLRGKGRAFKTTPAFGNITLGGAIGTGAHGSSIKYPASISSQVVGMTIVDGLGNLRTISNEGDLQAFKIHLGLLGIVVDITLVTKPLYKARAYNYLVSDGVLLNGQAIKWARETDQISLYWFPAFGEVVVANWTFVDGSTPGDAFTYDHVPSTYDNFNLFTSKVAELAFGLASSGCSAASVLGYQIMHVFEVLLQATLLILVPDLVPIYTEDGLTVKMPAVGYYDRMSAPVCSEEPQGLLGLGCIWGHGNLNANISLMDNEFSLALDDLPRFIKEVKNIITKTPAAFPMQGILLRFSSSSTIYMSNSYGRDSVNFEFYFVNRKNPYEDPTGALAAYQTIFQTLVFRYNGRAHWGKSGLIYASKENLERKLDHGARSSFIDAMNKFDPNEIFINNFGRRLKGTGTKIDIHPLTTRCALLENCFCSKNSDCGATQICTSIHESYRPFRVCKSIGEVTEGLIDKNKLPSPLGAGNWLLTVVPTLVNSLNLLGECTLDPLVGSVLGILKGIL